MCVYNPYNFQSQNQNTDWETKKRQIDMWIVSSVDADDDKEEKRRERTDDDKEEKRRERETLNPIVIVRFTPTTTERDVGICIRVSLN
jgi:hypothetical protein